MRGPPQESPEPLPGGLGGQDKGPRREQRPPGCRAHPHSDQPGNCSRCCVDTHLSGSSLQGPSREPSTSQMGNSYKPRSRRQLGLLSALGLHLLGPLPFCNEDPVGVTSSVIVPIVGMRKLSLGSQASPAAPTMTLWASGNRLRCPTADSVTTPEVSRKEAGLSFAWQCSLLLAQTQATKKRSFKSYF